MLLVCHTLQYQNTKSDSRPQLELYYHQCEMKTKEVNRTKALQIRFYLRPKFYHPDSRLSFSRINFRLLFFRPDPFHNFTLFLILSLFTGGSLKSQRELGPWEQLGSQIYNSFSQKGFLRFPILSIPAKLQKKKLLQHSKRYLEVRQSWRLQFIGKTGKSNLAVFLSGSVDCDGHFCDH